MKSTTLNMYRVVDFACVDMYISTFFIALGICTGKGNLGVLTENMCGIYHCCNTVYHQRLAAGDAGCV